MDNEKNAGVNATQDSDRADDSHAATLEVPTVTWWKDPGLRHLYLLIPIGFLGSTINGYDGSLLNGLQTLEQWRSYFNHPSGDKLGLFTSIQAIGSVCALPFSPYVADIFGRRVGVCSGLILIFVGVIIQSVPGVNEGMFIGGRFLLGLGSNVSQGSAPLLIMELAHPQHRGKITTMYNTLWYVGSIIAAWAVFGTVDYPGEAAWKVPVALQALMPLIQFCAIWLLPESPRWLCSKDRGDQALKVLVKYHASGDPNDPFVQAEYAEIRETIALEKQETKQNWDVFFRTPGNRKRLLLILLVSFFSQCSGNGIASYYLHSILESVGVTDSYEQSLVNGGLQIWSFLVAIIFSTQLVDKVGRRKLFLIAAIGMLLSFSGWTGCSAVYAQTGNPQAGAAVIAMVFLFYLAAGFAWPGLTVAYVAEILPYNIRAKGMAIGFASTSAASVLTQYVNPIGLEQLTWKFYFVYIAILIIEVLCIYFLFVETKGPTLEEIAKLFDGDGAAVAQESKVEKAVQSKAEASHDSHIEHAK